MILKLSVIQELHISRFKTKFTISGRYLVVGLNFIIKIRQKMHNNKDQS